MEKSTIEYTSIETYLNVLNRGEVHGRISESEVGLLDKALLCYIEHANLDKELMYF